MAQRRPWYSILYVQVLIAIVLGIFIGHFFSEDRHGTEAAG